MNNPDNLSFQRRAEYLLQVIERCCDHLNETTDWDIDNQRGEGMLSIELGKNSPQTWVIHLQKPLEEVWFATPQAGQHYRWDGNTWRDTKTGSAFWDDFSRYLNQVTGGNWVFQG
jgi:CyaY protein